MNRFLYLVMAVLAVMAFIFPSNDNSICAVVPPVVIAGALAGAGALMSGIFGSKSQASANSTNMAIAQQTNRTNLQIHKNDNEFNRQMAFDMFNAENEYNSPEAQAQRLREAGFNPAAMVEDGYNSVSADGSTPQAASPIPMQAATVQPIPSPLQSFFGNIGQAAQAFASFNEGNLSGAQKKLVLTQAQSEEFRKRMLAVDAAIKQAYGLPNASAAYQRSLKELQELDGKINNLALQGDVYEAEKLLKNAQRIKLETDNELERSTFESLVQQEIEKVNNLRKTGKLIDEQSNTEKSKQNELNTSAAVNKELKDKTHQESERLKIENRYIDDIDAAAYASNRADTILKLRQAYRTGHALYDGIRDFAHSIMRKLGMDPHNRNFESIEDLADEIIKGIKEDNK